MGYLFSIQGFFPALLYLLVTARGTSDATLAPADGQPHNELSCGVVEGAMEG
ncbi:MAG: hypothetical protein GY854_33785 [Deltaproteobacteria bacterium]|nr:hypothetical protein [Deltaproteobacteria bacterium]